MSRPAGHVTFTGSKGETLSARLDMPFGEPRAFALFAHCFTCSKDSLAAGRISAELATRGFGVLRFDFTGIGQSGGEFSNTDFSSNVADIVHAADWLRAHHAAPALLVGHSLGGAAVLAAAGDIPEARAVATIGAPADAEHVKRAFADDLDRIAAEGEATVTLAGREFRIAQSFVEDLASQRLLDHVAHLRRALLVLHAPLDDIVGIDNATELFVAAKHPKSFVSLDKADHLLTDKADAIYAADLIAAWAVRYVGEPAVEALPSAHRGVIVAETGQGRYQQAVSIGPHRLTGDEPEAVGGDDTGPSPYDFLGAALGTCTSMTLRMYAERKGLALDPVRVTVTHGKVHAEDCADCSEDMKSRGGKIDRFERAIAISGDFDEKTAQRLLEIADLCPVHKTLTAGAAVVTRRDDDA